MGQHASLFTIGKLCHGCALEGDMKVQPALADVEVKDTDGKPVRLGSLWADRPAVVIWVRHFG